VGQVTTIGLDVAKSTFQAHGVDSTGEVYPATAFDAGTGGSILREASTLFGWNRRLCDSHHWARELRKLTTSSISIVASDQIGCIDMLEMR
jgi:transposase